MTKEALIAAVEAAKVETKEALQMVYEALNNGQKKKLLKNDTILSLFNLYGVEYEDQNE
jgi:hypothetical protein